VTNALVLTFVKSAFLMAANVTEEDHELKIGTKKSAVFRLGPM
jgi:hypothetical protein